jgi:hypothetical protein
MLFVETMHWNNRLATDPWSTRYKYFYATQQKVRPEDGDRDRPWNVGQFQFVEMTYSLRRFY